MKKKEHIDGDGRVIRRLAAAMGLFAAAFCICWYIAGQVYLHNMAVVDTVGAGEGSLQKRVSCSLAEVAASAEPELRLTWLREKKYPIQTKTFNILLGERELSFQIREQESRIDGMAEISGAIPYSEWGEEALTGSEICFEQIQSDRYPFTLPAEAVNRTSETTGEVWVVVAATSWLGEDEWELVKWNVRILDSSESTVAISDRITDPVVK